MSRTDAGLCIYHLFVWLNSNVLHISQWIILPTRSCLVLDSFFIIIIIIIIMIIIISHLKLSNWAEINDGYH